MLLPGRLGGWDVGGRMLHEGAVRQDTDFLRQRGSPESKSIIAAHDETGE